MNTIVLVFILLFLLAMLSPSKQITTNRRKCSLLFCLDGFCVDLLTPSITPFLCGLMNHRKSSYSLKSVVNDVSLSGPSWTSYSTGVWKNKHEVITNKDPKNRLSNPYPSFITRLKQNQPNSKIVAFVHWDALFDWNIFPPKDCDISFQKDDDNIITEKVCTTLKDTDILTCVIVHLQEADDTGHQKGFMTNNYIKAAKRVDERVKTICQTLETRSSYDDEDWLICITTDHGGKNFDHGNNTWKERNSWIILNGDSVHRRKTYNKDDEGEILPSPAIIDIAPTILLHQGIQQRIEWNLDGRPMDIEYPETTWINLN